MRRNCASVAHSRLPSSASSALQSSIWPMLGLRVAWCASRFALMGRDEVTATTTGFAAVRVRTGALAGTRTKPWRAASVMSALRRGIADMQASWLVFYGRGAYLPQEQSVGRICTGQRFFGTARELA